MESAITRTVMPRRARITVMHVVVKIVKRPTPIMRKNTASGNNRRGFFDVENASALNRSA